MAMPADLLSVRQFQTPSYFPSSSTGACLRRLSTLQYFRAFSVQKVFTPCNAPTFHNSLHGSWHSWAWLHANGAFIYMFMGSSWH